MLINVNKIFKKVLKKPLKGASVSKIDYFKGMLLRKHGAGSRILMRIMHVILLYTLSFEEKIV